MDDKKIYWSISEVSAKFGVEQSVLRFWEKEFSVLCPIKNRGGARSYQKKDLETVEKIKYLLYDECLTTKGAVKKMDHLKGISLEAYKRLQNIVFNKTFIRDLEAFNKKLLELTAENHGLL